MPAARKKTVNIPLLQHTVVELRAAAGKLRDLAETVVAGSSTATYISKLETLATHFDTLAERREGEEREAYAAAEALALRIIEEQPEAEDFTAILRRDRPIGLPSAAAMRMASDAICRNYTSPDISQHAVIKAASLELSYLLMAYGMASTGQRPSATQAEPSAQSERVVKPGRDRSLDVTSHVGHYILVVDDVADVLVTVGAFLAKEGFTVQRAANGDEALRLIAEDPRIDVLVTDFAMPGLSGVELIAQAAQIRPNIKALVITGYPNADGLAELPPLTTVPVKPFRRNTLIDRIRSLLGEAQPPRDQATKMMEPREFETVEPPPRLAEQQAAWPADDTVG